MTTPHLDKMPPIQNEWTLDAPVLKFNPNHDERGRFATVTLREALNAWTYPGMIDPIKTVLRGEPLAPGYNKAHVEAIAAALREGISNSKPLGKTLYRGVNLDDRSAFQPGYEFVLPPSSFSTDPKVATRYSKLGIGHASVMVADETTRGLRVPRGDYTISDEHEVLSGGSFRVTAVEGERIHIIQTGTLLKFNPNHDQRGRFTTGPHSGAPEQDTEERRAAHTLKPGDRFVHPVSGVEHEVARVEMVRGGKLEIRTVDGTIHHLPFNKKIVITSGGSAAAPEPEKPKYGMKAVHQLKRGDVYTWTPDEDNVGFGREQLDKEDGWGKPRDSVVSGAIYTAGTYEYGPGKMRIPNEDGTESILSFNKKVPVLGYEEPPKTPKAPKLPTPKDRDAIANFRPGDVIERFQDDYGGATDQPQRVIVTGTARRLWRAEEVPVSDLKEGDLISYWAPRLTSEKDWKVFDRVGSTEFDSKRGATRVYYKDGSSTSLFGRDQLFRQVPFGPDEQQFEIYYKLMDGTKAGKITVTSKDGKLPRGQLVSPTPEQEDMAKWLIPNDVLGAGVGASIARRYPEAARQMVSALKMSLSKAPHGFEHFKGIYVSGDSQIRSRAMGRMGSNSYADFSPWVSVVRFSKKWIDGSMGRRYGVLNQPSARGAALEASYARTTASDSKYHPTSGDVPAITVIATHELGHHLETALFYNVKMSAEWDQILKDNGFPTWKDAAKTISVYARKNKAEFMAEAWADAMHSPTPAPISVKMAELMSKVGSPEYTTRNLEVPA